MQNRAKKGGGGGALRRAMTQTYLENQAFFVSTLQREAAEPQVVGAVLGQLPQETGDTFWRGPRHTHAGSDVKLNTLGGRLHVYRCWTKCNEKLCRLIRPNKNKPCSKV